MNAEIPGDAGEYLLTLISFIQQECVTLLCNAPLKWDYAQTRASNAPSSSDVRHFLICLNTWFLLCRAKLLKKATMVLTK